MNAVTLALYLGYGIYTVFPFKDWVLNMGGGMAASRTVLSILLFVIAVVIAHFIVKKVTNRTTGPSSFPSKAIQFVLAIAFIFALGYDSFAITRLYEFPPIINTVFNPSYFFYWFIAPLVGLFFFSR
jgi:hypothetical protein